jgi:nitrate reductase NapAB chaperone NapD
MAEQNEKSALESTAGNQTLQATVAASATIAQMVLSTLTAAPLLGLIPGFMGSLAQGRMERRVKETLQILHDELQSLQRKDEWTDDQLEFLQGAISSMVSTVDQSKLDLLRLAAKRAASDTAAVEQRGAALARTLHALTTAEIAFLVRNFGKRILVAQAVSDRTYDNTIVILSDSEDAIDASGLISAGLLFPAPGTWVASALIWSRTAARVLSLVKP